MFLRHAALVAIVSLGSILALEVSSAAPSRSAADELSVARVAASRLADGQAHWRAPPESSGSVADGRADWTDPVMAMYGPLDRSLYRSPDRPLPGPLPGPLDARPADPFDAPPDGRLFFVDDTVPPGFESLGRPRPLWVDVTFNGENVGTARITVTDDRVAFDAPAEVVAMLGTIIDPEALVARLAEPLAGNVDRLCFRPGDPVGCGRIEPTRVAAEQVAAILDESALQVKLFVTPALQRVQAEGGDRARYLGSPTSRATSVLAVRSVVSDIEGRDPALDLSARLLAARGRSHVAVAGEHGTSGEEARLRELRFTRHGNGRRFTAGSYAWSPSAVFTDIDLLGAGFASSSSTRLDLARAFGSELIVFLRQRSVVELLVDGRVYAGEAYASGRHLLDTRALPDGTYTIEIRVTGVDGETRSEFRTYTRSTRLPPRDEPRFEVNLGVVRDALSLSPEPEGVAVAGIALERRIDDRSAWQAGAARLGPRAVAHAGFIRLGERLSLQGTFALGDERTRAARGVIGWRHASGSLNASARYFSSALARDDAPVIARLYPLDGVQWNVNADRRIGRYALSLGAGRALSSLDGEGRRDSRRYRLSLRRPLRLGGGLRGLIGTGFSRVDGTSVISLGFDLHFDRGDWRGTLRTQASALESGLEPALGVSAGRAFDDDTLEWGTTLSARHGAEDSVGARLWLEHPGFRASASGQLSQGAEGDTRHGAIATFGTHVALDAAGLSFGGAGAASAGVIVAVEGTPPGAPFDIIVDERPHAIGRIGTHRFIDLAPFREYTLEISARGKHSIAFGEGRYTFTLYPGTVHRIEVEARPRMLLIGSLTDERGELLGGATIGAGADAQRSDSAGIVQLDVVPGEKLAVHAADGHRCTLSAPRPAEPVEILVAPEPLVCVRGAQ